MQILLTILFWLCVFSPTISTVLVTVGILNFQQQWGKKVFNLGLVVFFFSILFGIGLYVYKIG